MIVIAHRGASAAEPENTLRAFDLAIEQGAQMIELDLHLTADNRVVIIHDPVLDHTTDRTGRVDQLTLAEIKQADAGKGERVPTLEETFDLTLGKVKLYLEIKDPRAATETLRLIRARGCQSEVTLASFDFPLMRNLGPEVSGIERCLIIGVTSLKGLIKRRESFPWMSLRQINVETVSLQLELCFKQLVKKLKDRGKKLYVWTVDDERDFARLRDYRVDGIVTNVPDRLISFLSEGEPP
jgi:glycerophosphoryl diester phosphodiesterase